MATRSTRPSRILRQGNNGLYTNEWLLADTKTNEIAMFELGTHKSRLWKSSKNEWFGGTAGFYWGCNNAKDLQVRLETVPALDGRPANVVFHPVRSRPDLARAVRPQEQGDRRRLRVPGVHDAAPVGLALARRQVHHDGDGPRAQDLGEIRPAAGPHLGTDRRRAHAVHRDSSPGRQRLDDAPASTRRPPIQPTRVKPVDLARIDVAERSRARTSQLRRPGTARSCPSRTPISGWRRRSPITSGSSPAKRPSGPMPPAASWAFATASGWRWPSSRRPRVT